MSFRPDINKAKTVVKCDAFSAYSMAYVITNENLRQSISFMPNKCNRALTVAASGDHPLFCSLHGAKYVDTFDISYNAKCIMDIKTSAIKCLEYIAYIDLLKNLHWCENIKHVPDMQYISMMMPAPEWKYLCAMTGYPVFYAGIGIKDDNAHLVTEQEYNKMRQIVKGHYNFIMTDIGDLSNHLTESYDFIHLSNILDYKYAMGAKFRTLYPLLKHVTVGGRIVCHNLIGRAWEDIHPLEYFERILNMFETKHFGSNKEPDADRQNHVAKIKEMYTGDYNNFDYKRYGDIIVFERVR